MGRNGRESDIIVKKKHQRITIAFNQEIKSIKQIWTHGRTDGA